VVKFHGWTHFEDQLPHTYTDSVAFPVDTSIDGNKFGDPSSFVWCSQSRGSDVDGEGTLYKPYETIQHAIDQIAENEHRNIMVDDDEGSSSQNVTLPDAGIYKSASILSTSWWGGISTLTFGNNWSITINHNVILQNSSESGSVTWAEIWMYGGTVQGSVHNNPNVEAHFFGTLMTESVWTSMFFATKSGFFIVPSTGKIVTTGGIKANGKVEKVTDGTALDDGMAFGQRYTDAEADVVADASVADHVALSDPHIQYQKESERDVANGYCPLDAAALIPTANIPDAILNQLEPKGGWNATTNTPAIADATGSAGWFYIVNVAGTQDLGSGNISFDVGDWALHNGTTYEKILNSHAVSSVFGRIGAIIAVAGDYLASQINTTVGNFNRVLTASEDTVQKALDRIDDYIVLAKTMDGVIADDIETRFGIFDYVKTTGITIDYNSQLTGLIANELFSVYVTVEPKNLTYDDQLMFVPIIKNNWVTDHWETNVRVNKMYDDGVGGLAVEECATDDVTINIFAFVNEGEII